MVKVFFHQHSKLRALTLLQMTMFSGICEETCSLAKERINACKFHGSFDFSSDDSGAHLTRVAFVERDGKGFTCKGGLVNVNF